MSKHLPQLDTPEAPKQDPLDIQVEMQDVIFMQIGNLTYQALTAQKVSNAMEAKAREVLAERDAEIEHLKEELQRYKDHWGELEDEKKEE
jgi:hypothetical protein